MQSLFSLLRCTSLRVSSDTAERTPKYPVDNETSYIELTDGISRRLLVSYYSRPPVTSEHESTCPSLRNQFWTCHPNLLLSRTKRSNFKAVDV